MSLEELFQVRGRYHERMQRASELRAQAEEMEKRATERLENAIARTLDADKVPLAKVWKALGWSNVKTKAWADRARKRNNELLRKGIN